MSSSIRASELIDILASSLGTGGGRDLAWAWLEEAYGFLRDQGWAWNWKSSQLLTYASATEPTVTFTWVEGDNFVTASGAVSLAYTMTGRMVQLDSYWYTVVDYGVTSPVKVVLDRQIVGSSTAATVLTFYRGSYILPTSKIQSVHLAERKVLQVRQEVYERWFGMTFPASYIPTPDGRYYYPKQVLDESTRLQPPAYPLAVVSSGAGTYTNGTYRWFATRYDPESGAESPPGPEIEFTVTDGHQPNVTYTSPGGTAENYSYPLRYYRSEVNPERVRPPMYRVYQRGPAATAVYTDAVDPTPRNIERYYDGSVSEVTLWPYCDVRYSLKVRHIRSWGSRPGKDDMLPLGEGNALMELLRLHMTSTRDLQSRNTEEARASFAALRKQTAYLLGKSVSAADADLDSTNYDPWMAGGIDQGSFENGNVNSLPWGRDYA